MVFGPSVAKVISQGDQSIRWKRLMKRIADGSRFFFSLLDRLAVRAPGLLYAFHLNPGRAGAVDGKEKPSVEYPWSKPCICLFASTVEAPKMDGGQSLRIACN